MEELLQQLNREDDIETESKFDHEWKLWLHQKDGKGIHVLVGRAGKSATVSLICDTFSVVQKIVREAPKWNDVRLTVKRQKSIVYFENFICNDDLKVLSTHSDGPLESFQIQQNKTRTRQTFDGVLMHTVSEIKGGGWVEEL